MTNLIRAYWCKGGNFGDMLTKHWIEKLTGQTVQWMHPNKARLFACGSILRDAPKGYTGIILGTGFMYEEDRRPDLRDADIRSLRGPLTAERIGIDVPFGDFGLLFNLFKSACEKTHDIGSLPHYAVSDRQDPRHHLISALAGVDNVARQVATCRRLVTSSLHGIILADALGIESKWVKHKAVLGDGFKFRDYAASLGEDIIPGKWRLGDQRRVVEMAKRLREIVVQAIEDFTKGGEREDIMRIKCTNPGTSMLYRPSVEDRKVFFSRNGYAVVSDKLGRYLVRTIPSIMEVKPEKPNRTTKRTSKGRSIPLKEGE